MTKWRLGSLTFINLLFLFSAITFYSRPAVFLTRVHYFDMKVQDSSKKSSDESVASLAIVQEFLQHKLSSSGPWVPVQTPEEILQEFDNIRSNAQLDQSCKFTYQSSVESDGLFFDIECNKPVVAAPMFEALFWRLLESDMVKLGKTWRSMNNLKDFYYLNHLSPVSLSEKKRVAMPRYSFIFEDQLDRISIFSVIIYLVFSLGVINFFFFRIFRTLKRKSLST